MASETSTKHNIDQLERVLLDGNADPMYVPLPLLEEITNSFSDEHQIGSGGFAVVYKGIVGKGLIAVKKLSRTFDLPESKFHKEVECLVKAKHKNIVRFIGYCSETQGRIADYEGKFVMSDIRNWLLCFEYVPNGSLDKYITDASHGLEWKDRFEIIKGICEGLLYLHKMHILHLDLKPSNILIDDRMVPKIADFGLSRCLDKDQTRIFTSNLCGSQGYLAPELFRGQVAYETDIYSLGCIIVEILTGEKGYPEDENVVDNWMNRLEGSDHWDMQLEQIRVCMKIGIDCMDLNPKKRPVARHIVDRLDGTASSVETSIGSSSVEQRVSFLKEQYYQEKNIKLASEYPGKDKGEQAETEELVEYVGKLREEHWQQGQEEALGDQLSLWEAQDAEENVSTQGASLSSSKSGFLHRLKNLDIFNRKARREYFRRPVLEKPIYIKLYSKENLKPILKQHNLIGKGCFGEVYMGVIDGVPVVVKKQIGDSDVLDSEQFANEFSIQSKIIHKNIVRLIGCCLEVDIPMLVYEFVSKGSLHDILHGNNKVPLDMAMRLSIAAQAANGLAYMHSMNSIMILHGNFKSANILLDDYFVPKISDFGISRMFRAYYEHTGGLIGDIAYMDPVYLQTGLLTETSDVYSFGIVLMELLTRKKAADTENYSSLVDLIENHRRGRKSTVLFDKEIAVTGDLELLDNLAEIVVECVNLDTDLRPTMVEVAERLSKLNQSHKLAHEQAT